MKLKKMTRVEIGGREIGVEGGRLCGRDLQVSAVPCTVSGVGGLGRREEVGYTKYAGKTGKRAKTTAKKK